MVRHGPGDMDAHWSIDTLTAREVDTFRRLGYGPTRACGSDPNAAQRS